VYLWGTSSPALVSPSFVIGSGGPGGLGGTRNNNPGDRAPSGQNGVVQSVFP
jgi:hypothetical protein